MTKQYPPLLHDRWTYLNTIFTAGEGAVMKLLYLRPALGGIRDYSDAKLTILRHLLEVDVRVVTVEEREWPLLNAWRLYRTLRDDLSSYDRIDVELGAGTRVLFWLARHLQPAKITTLATIHDPLVVIDGLVRYPSLQRASWPLPGIERRLSALLHKVFGARVVKAWLDNLTTIYCLNPGLTSSVRGHTMTYMPHPIFHREPPVRRVPSRPVVAYLGFWSPSKGLEDLLAAFQDLIPKLPDVTFILAGSGAVSDDPYGDALRARVGRLPIELPGFIAKKDIDQFLQSLSLLVLPYHADVPAATSGMLMRAQEASVPLVVTSIPAFRHLVQGDAAIFVPPRDSKSLAHAIHQVLTHQSAAEERAKLAQARIYQTNCWEVVATELARGYGICP